MSEVVSRRMFMAGLSVLSVAPLIYRATAATLSGPMIGKEVSIENFSAAGVSEGIVRVAKIEKSEAEWRAQLSALSYRVTRQAGTEMAFSGEYDHNNASGLYRCICCGTALFSTDTKFDSGTGWPSFYAPMGESKVQLETDESYGMVRTEVMCRRCEAHLGHVFPDGPKPTGLRFCINSAALKLDENEKK